MRKVDAPVSLNLSSLIVENKIGNLNPCGMNAKSSLDGGKAARGGFLIVPGKQHGKIDAGELRIPGSQRSAAFHGSHQIVAANSVGGKGKRAGSRSANPVIQESHATSQLQKVYVIEAALERVGRIG